MIMSQDGRECEVTEVKTKSWKLKEDRVIVQSDPSEKFNHIFLVVLKEKYRDWAGAVVEMMQNKGMMKGNKLSLGNSQNSDRVMRVS